ncbi:nucleolus protein required for cell viability [Viridothelium virens]|uniref:Nucleolus protein required for cell viability n=1 Tax=Viridothelium virens TaxID=1048519 RepID=A0A6A6H230_VIRVR|nr:nucleolus protein required for cell viability [Viridothelium virens]
MPAHLDVLQKTNLPVSDDEDLADDQIHQLLEEAQTRLRAQRSTALARSGKDLSFKGLPRLDASATEKPYIKNDGGVARIDQSRLLSDNQRNLANGIRKIEDPVVMKKRAITDKKAAAGSDWFNLPKTNLTPELKRDLQLLKMRNVLDPHRHYKNDDSKSLVPEYSQVGTIVQGPTEFFSARLPNKERKRTFVEEVLAREDENGRFKNKYSEVQVGKRNGKKGHYKALQARKKRNMRR